MAASKELLDRAWGKAPQPHRTPWARRWRDLVEAHASDLGGLPCLTEAQRSLIRRVATIEIQLEEVEGMLSEGKSADLTAYASAAGHLRRILATLGVERRPRNITPDLQAYLRRKQADEFDKEAHE